MSDTKMSSEPTPSAASVSERTRGYHQHDAIEFAVRDLGYSPADAARITAAIEQALTQQRGEAVGEVGMEGNFIAYAIDDRTGRPQEFAPGTKLYTTPQPSADAVREYVTELRGDAEAAKFAYIDAAGLNDHVTFERLRAKARALHGAANKLESLLSAASGEKGVG